MPDIHPDAQVSPHAVIEGDVVIGPRSRVLAGAVLTGPIRIGASTIVMEHAVVRGTGRFPLTVGDHCLIGPHASLSGCTIDEEVFVATGASVFPAARLGKGSEVRINGVVHLRTVLPPGATVPIGWVAVGDPVLIAPSADHDRIWAVQRELDFDGVVFGVDSGAPDAMVQLTERYARGLTARPPDGRRE